MAWSSEKIEAAERRIDESQTRNFAELVKLAGLDPQRHLRFADWSGVDFSRCDLRGYDFTGARLENCKFWGALIETARFDQAEINLANLRTAGDWRAHLENWLKPPEAAPDDHLPIGKTFIDAPFAPEMVVVPPGSFWMGAEEDHPHSGKPRHLVTIPRAFAISKFPITVAEWSFAHEAGGVELEPNILKTLARNTWWDEPKNIEQPEAYTLPMTKISWLHAQAYVGWLSRKVSRAYRLLSEAEWEYACLAGSDAKSFATSSFNADRLDPRQTIHPGIYPPNTFGLHDMERSVWEWCQDCWHGTYEDKPTELNDNAGPWHDGDGRIRVIRPKKVHPTVRRAAAADSQLDYYGFRLARTLMFSS